MKISEAIHHLNGVLDHFGDVELCKIDRHPDLEVLCIREINKIDVATWYQCGSTHCMERHPQRHDKNITPGMPNVVAVIFEEKGQ